MEYIDYLNMIRETYTKLHCMALEQLELLSQDRLAEFLTLSSKIHGIQVQLGTLNREFLTTLPRDTDKSKIEDTKGQILSLQDQIKQIYSKMEELIAQKKNMLCGELAKIKKGQMAIRGYSSHDKIPPRFVEKVM